MINKTFWFTTKITLAILAVPLIPILLFVGCSYINPTPSTHYYKVQRLNLNGEVQQTYYSTGYPWGTDNYVTFKEYPSNRYIKMATPYVAEDIGTNKPSL